VWCCFSGGGAELVWEGFLPPLSMGEGPDGVCCLGEESRPIVAEGGVTGEDDEL